MEKTEKQYKRHPRRVMSKHSYTIPDASLSVRVLIDRTAKGLPVNAKLSKHIPLPPDGELMNDFDTGTEDICDVTDAVAYVDKIKAEQKYIAEQKQKAIEEQSGASAPEPTEVK